MKASVIEKFGSPGIFRYGEVPTPEPGPGEVRLRVEACGVNHFDIFLRRGEVSRELPLPHVMGADVVGVIDKVGEGVEGLGTGERVVVCPGFPLDPAEHDFDPINLAPSFRVTGGARWGGYAEYATAPARFVLRDPPALDPVELATIPLVLVTAVHATRTLGQVGPGQRVLVQAGASGSGAMCIQVARSLGAKVATTVGSDDKIEFVRRLGADEVINYSSSDFVEHIKDWTAGAGVDAVIDNVGGSVFEGNLKVLKRGGHFVNFGMVGGRSAPYVFPLVFYKQLHLHGSMMGTMEELHWGLQQVREGLIKPILDRALPLEQAAAAHAYIEDRKVKGKVVLQP